MKIKPLLSDIAVLAPHGLMCSLIVGLLLVWGLGGIRPTPTLWVMPWLAVLNILEWVLFWFPIYYLYARDDDIWQFWAGIMFHYAVIGGGWVYLFDLRYRLIGGLPPTELRATAAFLVSPFGRALRWVNKLSPPLSLAFLLIGIGVGFPLRSDLLFDIGLRGFALTLGLGGIVSLYLAGRLIRDASIRWRRSARDRSIATIIYSSFHVWRAVEKYACAVIEMGESDER